MGDNMLPDGFWEGRFEAVARPGLLDDAGVDKRRDELADELIYDEINNMTLPDVLATPGVQEALRAALIDDLDSIYDAHLQREVERRFHREPALWPWDDILWATHKEGAEKRAHRQWLLDSPTWVLLAYAQEINQRGGRPPKKE